MLGIVPACRAGIAAPFWMYVQKLVSTKFRCTTTRGSAAENDLRVAVCLRPGLELAFESDAQCGGMTMFNIGARLARFRKIDQTG